MFKKNYKYLNGGNILNNNNFSYLIDYGNNNGNYDGNYDEIFYKLMEYFMPDEKNYKKYFIKIINNKEYYNIYFKSYIILNILFKNEIVKHNNFIYLNKIFNNNDNNNLNILINNEIVKHENYFYLIDILTKFKNKNDNNNDNLNIIFLNNLGNSYNKKLENIKTSDILYSHLYICDVLQVLFKNGYMHGDITHDNITYTNENNEIKSYLINFDFMKKSEDNIYNTDSSLNDFLNKKYNDLNNFINEKFKSDNDLNNYINENLKSDNDFIQEINDFINQIKNEDFLNDKIITKYNDFYSYGLFFINLFFINNEKIYYYISRDILNLLKNNSDNIDFNIIKLLIIIYLYNDINKLNENKREFILKEIKYIINENNFKQYYNIFINLNNKEYNEKIKEYNIKKINDIFNIIKNNFIKLIQDNLNELSNLYTLK